MPKGYRAEATGKPREGAYVYVHGKLELLGDRDPTQTSDQDDHYRLYYKIERDKKARTSVAEPHSPPLDDAATNSGEKDL